MRNITFSADGQLIDRARLRARRENKTLNAVFREWLQQYAGNSAKADRKFTRDEMNSQ
jgi:hypothetical protein